MEILIPILGVILPLIAQAIQQYIEYQQKQKAQEKKSIDEALAKHNDAMLSAILDDQSYRVSQAVHRHTNAE